MFKRMLKKFQDQQMRRVAFWQLHNLSDHSLKDIGVSRSDIRSISNGSWDIRR